MDILEQAKIDRLANEIGQENVPVLLEIFLGELRNYISTLSSQGSQDQDAYLQEISHALKSSAASFGAEALRHYSVELDSRAKAGEALDSEQDKQQMLSLLQQTEQRYQQLVGK
ncbi:Hpt domain-containing protein [Vibrio sp. JPW-9-11-11]|uniref:quorum-sensing phosphorelay protein LuxU n=1 Tax=Vibrio sp. JPW-9-11-11 TaxID=1416532 RepID=UPI001594B934|nr:Hpt domain-containing protein [Vibrio sp. JPW-9-11-11]